MNKTDLYNLFVEELKGARVLIDEPMKKHTSFRIGGPVDLMIIPANERELIEAINICRNNNINYIVMGNGSNILVSDTGIRGVVIKIAEALGDINVNGTKLKAQAGALLTVVSKRALKASLKGLEFANGIPGSIGGAITMNAGAYGGEMKDIVTKVKCIDKNGEIIELSNEEMKFRYRGSRVQDEGLIVVEVEMELEEGDYDEISGKMKDYTERRTTKQPLNLPSGGSTFKRPEGHYAGKLIEDSGLKGIRLGGAQVSELHSGFIVNVDNATCNDVVNLIKVVQKIVRDKYDVLLEPEIKFVGEE
ncbi:UDP-N-acetylmuramate dehydrogenase [Anaerosalibacter sp. Marseille-P3206]|uniref:UDP-N-acetylmuramate dehydrogenase n=1 Tax=Anaerosalibacter sp. Marseille-P3206 TaxID=1871005 RepID=UPI000985C176|nr:UDP-N-acetylmuramate dehydrogenase [Anaerosalibacter sp. Marseille-P3206]